MVSNEQGLLIERFDLYYNTDGLMKAQFIHCVKNAKINYGVLDSDRTANIIQNESLALLSFFKVELNLSNAVNKCLWL